MNTSWLKTFGLWGPRGLKFVKEIGRKIQEKTGNKNATSHIIQAISMTVQRGNTTSIMGTLGPTVGNPVVTTHKRYFGPPPFWQIIWAGLNTALFWQV